MTLINFQDWKIENKEKYQVESHKISWNQIDRTTNCFIYNEFLENEIINFEHSFEVEINKIKSSEQRNRALINLWNCRKDLLNNSNQLWLYVNQYGIEGKTWRLIFAQRIEGDASNRIHSSEMIFNINQKYYVVISKNYEIFRIKIYKDKEKSMLIYDSGLLYWKDEKYKYVLLANGFQSNEASNDFSSGYISNFKIKNIFDIKVFLSIPMTDEYDKIKNTVMNVTKEIDMELKFYDDKLNSGISISNKIQLEILNSDIIIADITNMNPNIFYEVGYAEALKKNIILIIDGYDKTIPSNISSNIYIVYDKNHISHFENQLKNWLLRVKNDILKKGLII